MRPSQNIPLPPRIYPPFQQMYMCDPPRIVPSLPEYTPLFNNYIRPSRNLPLPEYTPFCNNYTIMRPSENLSLLPRIYPPFNNYMRPSRIYPSLPKYTPIFNNCFILRPSKNLSLPSTIYHPFNNSMRHSQNIPLPQIIQPSFLTTICHPPFQNISLVPFLQLYVIFQVSTPQSLHMPPSLHVHVHVIVRESTTRSHNWKILWEGGADSGRVAKSYSSWKGG